MSGKVVEPLETPGDPFVVPDAAEYVGVYYGADST